MSQALIPPLKAKKSGRKSQLFIVQCNFTATARERPISPPSAWRIPPVEDTIESVADDLLEGQYNNPVRIIGLRFYPVIEFQLTIYWLAWQRRVAICMARLPSLAQSSVRQARNVPLGPHPSAWRDGRRSRRLRGGTATSVRRRP